MRIAFTMSRSSRALASLTMLLSLTLTLSACDEGEEGSTADQAVTSSLSELEAYSNDAGSCMDAMVLCMEEGGDEASCRDSLEGCLPETRPRREGADGSCGPPPPRGERADGEGMGGERPDGPPPPPRGERPDGPPPEGMGGDRPDGPPPPPPRGERPDGPPPEGERPDGPPPSGEGEMSREAPEGGESACRGRRVDSEVLDDCMASAGECDDEGCREAVHACIHDAVEAEFLGMCYDHLAACEEDAPEAGCGHIAERCEEGARPPRR